MNPKINILSVCMVLLSLIHAIQGNEVPILCPGDVVYQTDFNRTKGLEGWTGDGRLEKAFTRGFVLSVHRPAGPAGNAAVSRLSIPCVKYRGCLLLISTMVKGESINVGVPAVKNTLTSETVKTSPHAVKCMVTAGNESYQAAVAGGTFDWKQTAVRVFVPWDATRMTVTLGLEAGVTGKVWFDDVKIQIRQVDAFPKGKVEMGPWKFPCLRGAMIDPRGLTEKDCQVLGGQWKANLVRWQFLGAPDPARYDQWLEGEIKRLDAMLPILRKYGIYVVVDLHCPPGGTSWEGGGLFSQTACQQKTIDAWRKLARHYKGVEGIFGYDLVNEPIDILGLDNVGYDTVPGDVLNWWELGEKISQAIRQIDPETPIIFEPSPGGVPYAFPNLKPFNISNVIYSTHMYMPYQFTHQLVLPCFAQKLRYPGFELGGQIWDGNRVRAELGHVVDFQQKWGARIYVGEFSAVRWAPDNSAYRYLKDITDVFEAHGWDWTYHAFREFDGWSVELSEDKDKPIQKVTDRQKLLRALFSKNIKKR